MKVLLINPDNCRFFSLHGTPHFTASVELAQSFDSLSEAQLWEEQYFNSADYKGDDDVYYELVTEAKCADGSVCYISDVSERAYHGNGYYHVFDDQEGEFYFMKDKKAIYFELEAEA